MTTNNPAHTNQGGHHDREGRSNQDDKAGSNPGKQAQHGNSGEGSGGSGQQGGQGSRDDNRDQKNA